jgi:hypothetical protein
VRTLPQLTPVYFMNPSFSHTHFGPHDYRQLDRDFPAYYHAPARLVSRLGAPNSLPDRPQLVQGDANAARELVHKLAELLVVRLAIHACTVRRAASGKP